MSKQLIDELNKLKNPEKVKRFLSFFRTGKGKYGEGDKFLGLTVPYQRSVAKKYLDLSLGEIQKLLNSNIHEHRFTALIILIDKYKKANEIEKKKIVNLYLKNTKNINNWDLVDVSAPNILGDYLLKNDREILYDFAKSNLIWEKRIAIISTLAFIRKDQFEDTFKISEILLKDKHDLIHKAVGWMLRELGKRNEKILKGFLDKYAKKMPRMMLRYAVEKLPETKRRYYLELR